MSLEGKFDISLINDHGSWGNQCCGVVNETSSVNFYRYQAIATCITARSDSRCHPPRVQIATGIGSWLQQECAKTARYFDILVLHASHKNIKALTTRFPRWNKAVVNGWINVDYYYPVPPLYPRVRISGLSQSPLLGHDFKNGWSAASGRFADKSLTWASCRQIRRVSYLLYGVWSP